MKRNAFVHLAYYHTGFTDDAPILIDVCDSEPVALDAIAIHKEQRDRQCEYKDLAHWWTEKRTIRTANSLQMLEPPLSRLILLRYACGICSICGSSLQRKYGWFGKIKCVHPFCKSNANLTGKQKPEKEITNV